MEPNNPFVAKMQHFRQLDQQGGPHNIVKMEIPGFSGDMEPDNFVDWLVKIKKISPTKSIQIMMVLHR